MTTETAISYEFEVLCVKHGKGLSYVNDEESLLHLLLANSSLWTTNNKRLNKQLIEDTGKGLSVTVLKMEKASDTEELNFVIKVKGNKYPSIENFRIPLVEYMNKQGFNKNIYILTDDISSKISHQIYPLINKVENKLRKYLIKFFVTKLGSADWWKTTADSEMHKKVDQRKNNEPYFSQYVDNKVYLVDFRELGMMIYSLSSGFVSKESILKKVEETEESVDGIKKLKEELQSNYVKFFKENFKNHDFQKKWEDLEKIRHKVAHNNLFIDKDLSDAEELSKSLIELIDDADKKMDEVVFSSAEQQEIQNNIIESSLYRIITEETLLEELARRESSVEVTGGFVGLSDFVKNHLGSQGYDYKSTYVLINKLNDERKVLEIYPLNDNTNGYSVSCIRTRKGNM